MVKRLLPSLVLKRLYVAVLRRASVLAMRTGLLSLLEGRDARWARWARSLFAIHNLEELIKLDLAWWTLDAIDIVEEFLASREDARVFEYGSGASTLWLGRRAHSVTSVEHDSDWARAVEDAAIAMDNVTVRLEQPEPITHYTEYRSQKPSWTQYDFESYVLSIRAVPGEFDLIVIDGRCRSQCLRVAASRLKSGGMILFDNSRRRRYRFAIAESSLYPLVTAGLAVGLPYPEETTLLFAADDGTATATGRASSRSSMVLALPTGDATSENASKSV